MADHLGLLLALLFAAHVGIHGAVTLAGGDADALRDFARGIWGDPSGFLAAWGAGDHCTWRGVDCAWIGDDYRVVGLQLASGGLEGTISAALGRLSELRRLDLSGNRLLGGIPAEVGALPELSRADFSNNRLSGAIPHCSSFQRWGFVGNPRLCGRPLEQECGASASPSRRIMRERTTSVGLATAPTTARAPAPAATRPRRRSRNKAGRWALGIFLGIIAGGVAGLLLGGGAKILWRRSRRDAGIVIFHPKISPNMLLGFLDRPKSFEQMELLGSGAAGKVYKATLGNGLTVAIKRIPVHAPAAANSSGGAKRTSSFGKMHVRAELETLGKIRHLNLAWLYAYIPKLDAHHLLYQFMPNGSLADALQRVREGSLELDWKARQRIAIGMAAGLKYLHYDCTPKVLHRDLKPANILLDENYEAHLGDFGLAKALPDEMTHVTTQVAGTVGYIAPEYSQTCTFTTSSDVYSLGVVLGVLLCGREPTDDSFGESNVGLVDWMCHLVRTGQEVQGIDAKLLHAPDRARDDQFSVNDLELAEMKLAMQVVCLCTRANPVDRPSMKDVMVMLNPSRQPTVRSLEELINHD